MALTVWRRWQRWWQRLTCPPEIPVKLWKKVLLKHPFIAKRSPSELEHLRSLCQHFLASKEFHGAQGLRVTDDMALTIAMQACLPLLHWGPSALRWYYDFVGIVLYPDTVVAQREVTDETGVVHRYREPLLGEAMAKGPLMLVWSATSMADTALAHGHNLVIHEFAHKLDMRHKRADEPADGCPRLPNGWLGLAPAEARRHWRDVWGDSYAQFCRAVEMHERFGAPAPWLDSYGAQSPAEFFAVCCEAYFVSKPAFAESCPTLVPLLDAFFGHPAPINGATTP